MTPEVKNDIEMQTVATVPEEPKGSLCGRAVKCLGTTTNIVGWSIGAIVTVGGILVAVFVPDPAIKAGGALISILPGALLIIQTTRVHCLSGPDMEDQIRDLEEEEDNVSEENDRLTQNIKVLKNTGNSIAHQLEEAKSYIERISKMCAESCDDRESLLQELKRFAANLQQSIDSYDQFFKEVKDLLKALKTNNELQKTVVVANKHLVEVLEEVRVDDHPIKDVELITENIRTQVSDLNQGVAHLEEVVEQIKNQTPTLGQISKEFSAAVNDLKSTLDTLDDKILH